MKKILILIVVIALFLHFNPQPEVNEFLEKQKTSFLDTMAEFSGTGVRMKASTIISKMDKELSSFSSSELNKLKEITLTRDSARDYLNNHCQPGQSDPEFHSHNHQKVCQQLRQFFSSTR
ncbi:hypothetical protein LP316_02490 [Thalassotalea sp. LPB0316]|uniref:hypothetical protein n=1 Tax=Thalassotalea sp. LPB0316 TaxID=2769490 RepID=UPI001865E29D|nr:hypothetical protein [Thalassotalea sp. LPB0316]QOL26191.1 hypothetical protein LP316_02490 [Thalassotalea sp. LPB0316]